MTPLRDWAPDLRITLRSLRRSPVFALVVIVTLALSIGATTTMIGIVNSILLRGLPFPKADQLVALCETHPSVSGFCIASPPNATEWRKESRLLSALGIGRDWSFVLRREGGTSSVAGGLATDGLFDVLGARAAQGRLFTSEDLRTGARRVTVLSHEVWRDQFGADPGLIGRSILLDDSAYVVVGVLPAGFEVPVLEWVKVWTPLPFDPTTPDQRSWRGFRIYGRLAEGATRSGLSAELGTIQARIATAYPATNKGWGVEVRSLHDEVVGRARPALLAFLIGTIFVLLVGCANIANLFLARWGARRREIAVRAALGSGAGRIARMLLTESFVLALAGSALGLLLVPWTTHAFVALAPPNTPRLAQVGVSPGLVLTALLGGIGVTLLAGLAPVLRISRFGTVTSLQGMDTRSTGRDLLRRTLVVTEIVLAVVLLVGAGLLGRSFVNLLRWTPGFERQHLLTFSTFLSPGRFPTKDQVIATNHRIRAELATLPGMNAVGQVSAGPLFGGREVGSFRLDGTATDQRVSANWYDASPGYLRALGLPLRRGRWIEEGDVRGGTAIAVVNETFARRAWPGQDAIGRVVSLDQPQATHLQVVGVVADITPFRAGEPAAPEVYWAFDQEPRWATYWVLRTADDPALLERTARDRLQAAFRDVEMGRARTMEQLIEGQMVSPRFNLALIGSFALVALFVAGVGVYGVVNYLVTQRTKEIGIRIALGADAPTVVRLVLGEGVALAGVGGLVGIAGAIVLARLLPTLLAGVPAADPVTLLVVPLVLTVATALAAWFPARRAARTHPMVVLRAE